MKYGIIFFILFLLPTAAQAQEEKFEDRIDLPKVETREIDGSQMKCLDVEQWKTVILIASEYRGLYEWRLKTVDTLNTYKLQVRGYETTVLHYESIMDIQAQEVEYLSNRIDDLLEANNESSLTSQIKEIVLYAVILAEAAGILALTLK